MSNILGAMATDSITGFKGRVTGVAHYISGCSQALLVPKVGDDGKLPEGHWFDVQRLEIDTLSAITLDNHATPGPDKAPPKR